MVVNVCSLLKRCFYQLLQAVATIQGAVRFAEHLHAMWAFWSLGNVRGGQTSKRASDATVAMQATGTTKVIGTLRCAAKRCTRTKFPYYHQ